MARIPVPALLIVGLVVIAGLVITTRAKYCLSVASPTVHIRLEPAPPAPLGPEASR